MLRVLRPVVALTWTGLAVAFFVTYYSDVRGAPPDTIVDAGPAAILLGLVAFVPALVIARWWGALLPLMTFPIAAAMLLVTELDDTYATVARDRGGETGLGWFGVAGIVCVFALPASFLGSGLGALAQRGR